ncbi:MAG: PAS domain-containing protein [Planctomycetales bacterium]|nr:PAS domain-containing protein [Planctomycetales bacterium]
MFNLENQLPNRRFKVLIGCLLLISVANLSIGVWLLRDVQYEQGMVDRMVGHLPAADRQNAEVLARELRIYYQLVFLVVVNVIAGFLATAALGLAYAASQRRLREARVAANDILFSLRHAVVTLDEQGLITSYNRKAAALLTLDDRVLGSQLSTVASQRPPLDSIVEQLAKGWTGEVDMEFDAKIKGHPCTFLAGCSVLKNESDAEMGRILHLHDITENVLIEKRLRRMERYQSLGTLAAGLHHEIRNPLSALSLHVQLLQEELEKPHHEDRVAQLLDVLTSETRRMTKVLDSFRNFASASELNVTSFDWRTSISRLLAALRPQAEKKAVAISFTPDEPADFTIEADQTRIDQVAMNLFLNAIEAMPEGGTLDVGLKRDARGAVLTVRDTGHGVPENVRRRIFEPYFTTKREGTGLGLALCDKLVGQHGGAIQFESSDAGSCFTVTLPRSVA